MLYINYTAIKKLNNKKEDGLVVAGVEGEWDWQAQSLMWGRWACPGIDSLMAAQPCECAKNDKSYIFKWWTLSYANYISDF